MTARQHIRRALVILLALLAFIACATVSPTVEPTPASAPVATRERLVLLLWYAWPLPEDRILSTLVDHYNRRAADVQIVLQARPITTLTDDLAMAVAEGGGPHMVILHNHNLGALADSGSLLALDDLVPAATTKRLLPTALSSAMVRRIDGSSLYGVPLTFDTLALYYNKSNFAAKPPSNTDALLATARGLTDTRSDPPTWGLALNLSLDRSIGYLYAFGGRVFDEENNIVLGLDGRTGAEAWLSWLQELNDDERILASTDGIVIDNALAANQALMAIDWSYALDRYREIWPESLGVAMLPRLSETDRPPQPYVQTDVIALNARIGAAEERQAALDFINYLVSAETQLELLRGGRQPVLLSIDLNAKNNEVDPVLLDAARVFRTQAEAGLPMPNSRQSSDIVWPILSDMHAAALRRLVTPEQAVASADTALRAQLPTATPVPGQ